MSTWWPTCWRWRASCPTRAGRPRGWSCASASKTSNDAPKFPQEFRRRAYTALHPQIPTLCPLGTVLWALGIPPKTFLKSRFPALPAPHFQQLGTLYPHLMPNRCNTISTVTKDTTRRFSLQGLKSRSSNGPLFSKQYYFQLFEPKCNCGKLTGIGCKLLVKHPVLLNRNMAN